MHMDTQQQRDDNQRVEHQAMPDSAKPGHSGSEQLSLIQQIRRGYNQEVVQGRTPEDEQAIRQLVQMNSRQAQVLSTELYTKPTHFLLELLQNADDCSYAAGVQPRVMLVLMQDALLHATNETGFTPDDIRSICSMAMSTKSRKVGAFTGEKGIGFKATAVASEVTFISSNGYTFCFDMRPEAYDIPCLGLFCPRWEEGLQGRMQEWLSQRLAGTGVGAEVLEGFTTLIWMQLRPGLDRQRLIQELQLLDPYMLLNLRKLKNVTVLIAPQPGCSLAASTEYCQAKELVRVDVDDTQVTLSVEEGLAGQEMTSTTRHLLCLRQALQVPQDISAAEDKRAGVEVVEVVFALPITADGHARPDPHAQVFAFLPVKAYGFRFHIQADFILPSSREGILEDRSWNRWLQEELAPSFIQQAMQAVKAQHQHQHSPPDSNPSEAAAGCPGPTLSLAALLQYLPLPDEVSDDFMSEVSTAILQGMQQQPCVLTASGQLSTAQHTLLPDSLLMAGGQQLISKEWLQQGLPGLEYVHDELLAGPEATARRATHVLLQLGSRRFSASLLLSWLTAERTSRLLKGLGPEERAAWLQLLYSCCMKLRLQPDATLMHLAYGSSSRQALRSAHIVQLHGSRELVSVQQLAESSKQLYLWDDRLGSEAELQLFVASSPAASADAAVGGGAEAGSNTAGSCSSSSLCFVDLSTLGADGAAMLRTFLGVSWVPLSVLVKHILQQQAQGGLSDTQQDQLLLFLMRNAQHVDAADLLLLRDGLMLRCAEAAGSGGTYAPAKQLYLPLEVSSLPVTHETVADPALQRDLATAGVAFVSSHYEALGEPSQLTDSQAVWQLLKRFGLQQLNLPSAVQHLLKLYNTCSSSSSSEASHVTLADHKRHLSFLAQSKSCRVCLQHIQQQLLLYHVQQDAAVEVPAARPAALFWPMPSTAGADALTDQLRVLCGVSLVHPWYAEQSGPVQELVREVTKALSLPEVWDRLLELHSTQHLQQCADSVGVTLQELLLQQVHYLAGVRLALQALRHQQQQHYRSSSSLRELRLLSSTGQLVACSQLYLPPEDAVARGLLQELEAAGHGLQLLHPCFEPCWREADSEQHLLLTKLLGVRQADAAAVVRALVGLHSTCSASLSEPERSRHLAYLAQHMQLLREQQGLLRQVQDSVLLLDAVGQHHKASALYLPLGQQFAALQSDMAAAGMLFLSSSYIPDPEPQALVITSDSVQRRQAQRQLEGLLGLLGVQLSDVNSIVKHIVKLYSGAKAALPGPEQHRTHLEFIKERWYDLEAPVKGQVSNELLLLGAAAPTTDTCAAADSSSSSSGGSQGSSSSSSPGSGRKLDSASQSTCRSSTICSWLYTHGSCLYILPPAKSVEAELIEALHLGSARFLHPIYHDTAGEELVLWLHSKLGVQHLEAKVAAKHLLAAHYSGQLRQSEYSPQQLADHALYLAHHADRDDLTKARHRLLLAVQHGSQEPLYTTASNSPPLYYQAQGNGWALQQVLPCTRVTYLHPAYVELVTELEQDAGRLYEASKLKALLQYDLGVNMRPVVGSKALKKVIQAGYCWEALLLLLHDEWHRYTSDDQQQLLAQLEHLRVSTSCGVALLPECFLPKSSVPNSLLQLLQDLKLPILRLPDPDSSGWAFLQELGVSMELQGCTLLKILQQLSSSGASPKLDSMQQLYSRIHALCQLDERVTAAMCAAFGEQRLVFVPGTGKSKGSWRRSSEVCWKPAVGVQRLFPHTMFIEGYYGYRRHDPQHQSLENFFVQSLRVRNAAVDDLKDSLLHFATLEASIVGEKVWEIYELLAAQAELRWLQPVLSREPVLLVQRGGKLSFARASSTDIYLPDSSELQQVFAADITTLAVPAEKLPILQPLLANIHPALPSLSGSVQRSLAEADGAQKQPERFWAQRLQQALPFLARFLYSRHLQLYKVLLEGGHLLQLSDMPVFVAPGLVRRLTLGDVSKQIPTQAAAQMLSGVQLSEWLQQTHSQAPHQEDNHLPDASSTQHPVLLVDAAATSSPRELLLHISVAYVDLLLLLADSSSDSSASSSSSKQPLTAAGLEGVVMQLRSILKEVITGDVSAVDAELVLNHIPTLPPEYNPWLAGPDGICGSDDDSSDSSSYSAHDADHQQGDSGSEAEAAGGADLQQSDSGSEAEAAEALPHASLDTEHTGFRAQEAGAGAAHPRQPGVQLGTALTEQLPPAAAAAAGGGRKRQGGSSAASSAVQPVSVPAQAASASSPAAAPCTGQAAAPGAASSGQAVLISRDDVLEWKEAFLAGLQSMGLFDGPSNSTQADDGDQGEPAASIPDAAGASLDEVVPQGVERDWLAMAVSAAQVTASRGSDLQQYWQKQPQQSGRSMNVRLPSSYIVQLPAGSTAAAPAGGAAWRLGPASTSDDARAARSSGSGLELQRGSNKAQHGLGTAADSASSGMGGADLGQGTPADLAAQPDSTTPTPPVQPPEVPADWPKQRQASTAEVAAAATHSSRPVGSGSSSQWPAADPYAAGHLKVIGDVGERFVYELFANTLPGFDSSCWHSGSRSMIGLLQPEVEPSYDFLYTDVEGQLSGKPGTRCFIECKATTSSLSSSSSPKPFEISARQWELAHSLHLNPDQGVFMIVRVDRVGSAGGPRIAAVLQDPVQLLIDGQLWITTPEKLLIERYPVAHGGT